MSNIVRETCVAVWTVLPSQYLNIPSIKNEWLQIVKAFEEEGHFRNHIGAKHVITDCPKKGGCAYYNFKVFHSIVLLSWILERLDPLMMPEYCLTQV